MYPETGCLMHTVKLYTHISQRNYIVIYCLLHMLLQYIQ